MKYFDIKGTKRQKLRRQATERLRKEGRVPCVLYGGKENIHFSTELKNFNNLVYTPKVFLINIDIEGDVHKAIMYDIQYHPVTDKIMHVDFYEIFEDQEVSMHIPVELKGVPVGVEEGGNLRQRRRNLLVRGLPKNFPDTMVIDIADLNVNDTIRIEELSYDNLELMDPQKAMVVGVVSSRVVAKGMREEVGVTEEELEAAEGEGAEATAADGEQKEEGGEEKSEGGDKSEGAEDNK